MEKSTNSSMAATNGSMEYKCEICEDVFSSKQKLKYHFVSVHDPNEKAYCNILMYEIFPNSKQIDIPCENHS